MKGYRERFSAVEPELKWLFYELYAFLPMEERDRQFGLLRACMASAAAERNAKLRALDEARTREPGWYQSRRLLGMCLYVKEFAGTLRGVREKLPYLSDCGVNYVHLMPLLDTVDGESDGGYAVADFRRVKPELGTMADLEALTEDCHDRGMCCCMDFVMNHTSSAHPWARKARSGDREYRDYYFFYNDRTIPDIMDRTVPQVFPVTAPGNFTELSDGSVVMTTFYPYQWDLNYRNPAVLRVMTENLLYLANRGVDVIRVDAVPYIWKEVGTDCRNLPQVHTILRICRLICEAVCPGVILLGEVVMAPEKLAPYFGPVDKPECHMLYNATAMCTLWHTVAAGDAELLRHQLRVLTALPASFLFLNYVRCHDDIGWGLDFPFLAQQGMQEIPHKAYLNSWFAGEWPGSPSRGERYNDDPRLGDARMCGTTASLTGLESAVTAEEEASALRLDLMLHAFMLTLSGLPILYAGDEIGQLNDASYHADPLKADDSRYLHRGAMDWSAAARRNEPGTREHRLFTGLAQMVRVRKAHDVFEASAKMTVPDTSAPSLLRICRECGGEIMEALFNFGYEDLTVALDPSTPGTADDTAPWQDLLSGEDVKVCVMVPARSFRWVGRKK